MRIQHNIAALNSYRQLSGNNNAVAKNLEKLSSGYRINRAGDDAAGLAISEKMRAQIKGLETAQKNANDGISLVQTAEGALTEVHSMLNRMVELATQSANGTYDNSVDRANLQKELDSLLDEVDRISEATNFNGLKLLDGSLGGAKVATTQGTASVQGYTVGAEPVVNGTATVNGVEGTGTPNAATITIDFAAMDIKVPTDGSAGSKVSIAIGDANIEFEVTTDMDKDAIATAFKNAVDAAGVNKINGVDVTVALDGTDKVKFTATDDSKTDTGFNTVTTATTTAVAGKLGGTFDDPRVDGAASTAVLDFDGRQGGDFLGGTLTVGNTIYSFVEKAEDAKAGTTAVVIAKNSTSAQVAAALQGAVAADAPYAATLDGMKVTFTEVGTDATDGSVDAAGDPRKNFSGKEIGVEFEGTGLRLQVGDTDDDFQKVRVAVGNMSTKGLDLDGLKSVGILDQSTAGMSIDKIKTAINTVSSTRGDLGAIQNRLEHTINNLGVTTENMTAAESRIRDTDMAQEMMSYTKNNILVQAAQAMLAQANQVPQGVLQLLQ